MDKTVFFLGAGSTKAVCPDAPLNRDLIPKALENPSNSIQAEKLNRFMQNLFKKRKQFPAVNQIWDFLDYLSQKGRSASPEYNLEQIAELRSELVNMVIKQFKESLKNVATQIFDDFVGKIKDKNIAIISPNYDILIENAFTNISFNYGTKMRQVISRGQMHGKSGLRRPEAEGCPGGLWLNQGRIPILKIHGSLNWLYCSKCNEVDITLHQKGAEELTESDYYCYNTNCTNKYEPLLITPTMYKNYENRVIKEVWDCAEKQLKEAENVVFIGYGLKDEDYEIRCLLMKALLNKETNYKAITVIEKCGETKGDKEYLKSVKKKYADLYGKQRVDFQPIGFDQYVKGL